MHEISFSLSYIDDSLDNTKKVELTWTEIKRIALDGGLDVLLDGIDELDMNGSMEEIMAIKMKVMRAHNDESIQISGKEYVIGLLHNKTLPNANLVILGRNNSIDALHKDLFTRELPAEDLRHPRLLVPVYHCDGCVPTDARSKW